MPQASEELRGKIGRWFGSRIDEQGPMTFLESHGFVLTKSWEWQLPTPYHQVSCYEWMCILFLSHEWDFGGIMYDNNRKTICLCGRDKE